MNRALGFRSGMENNNASLKQLVAKLRYAVEMGMYDEQLRLISEIEKLNEDSAVISESAPEREKLLLSVVRWYAGNNSWLDVGGPDEHHPKIRDCGEMAKYALLENAALKAGWEHDTSPATEGWNVIPWRTPDGKLVRDDELGEHFTSDIECPTSVSKA